MSKATMQKAEHKHRTVRIPRGMAEALEEFLQNPEAKRMGFDSKVDVITTAVRELLTRYGFYKLPAEQPSP